MLLSTGLRWALGGAGVGGPSVGIGDAAWRQRDGGAQPLVGIGVVRDRHRADEELLEARLDGGLDLLDPPHDLLDLGAGGAVEQRDPGTGARSVAGRGDVGGIAVGDEAEHERVTGSMWLPKAPASRIRSTRSIP